MASHASLARRRVSSLLASARQTRTACCAGTSHSLRASSDPSETSTSRTSSFSFSPRTFASGRARTRTRERSRGDDDAPHTEENRAVLLRDFLRSALYDKKDGYFSQTSVPVGTIAEPIAFTSLLGRDEYALTLNFRYEKLAKQWLTPVEIFKPYYASAVAAYVLDRYFQEDFEKGFPLKVYELGGGQGTNAVGFLTYVRETAPEVFARMEFVGVEISASLAAAQKRNVMERVFQSASATYSNARTATSTAGNIRADFRTDFGSEFRTDFGSHFRTENARVSSLGKHSQTYTVQTRDAVERYGWGEVDETPCFVVALEVLDNLPHDKLAFDNARTKKWYQTMVIPRAAQPEVGSSLEYEEVSVPITDPLIERAARAILGSASTPPQPPASGFGFLVAAFESFTKNRERSNRVFLPTGCLRLLETLHEARPNHRLVAADFDALPDVRMVGRNAPIVATQEEGGKTKDLETYLARVGSADVFFPTDFENLVTLDDAAFSEARKRSDASGDSAQKLEKRTRRRQVMSTRAFMEKWADVRSTETRSGYNPLLQDFANTKFFLS